MLLDFPYEARRVAAALLVLQALTAQALAGSPALDDTWRDEEEPYDPPSLPETLRGTIRRTDSAQPVERIDTIRAVFQAIQACWRAPAGSGFSGQEITIRLSFRRDGSVIGQPRITFYREGTQAELREPFTRAVREAFERCTPLPFTEKLGAAIAGRVFAIRFIDSRAM